MRNLIFLLTCLVHDIHGRRVISSTQQVKWDKNTDSDELATSDDTPAFSNVFAALDMSNGLAEANGPQDSSKALGKLLLALSPSVDERFYQGGLSRDDSSYCLLETDSMMDDFSQYTTKLVAKATFSSVMGFACGYCIKKLGRAAAFAGGLIFMFLAALELKGYVTVNWDKVAQDTVGKWDLDGDGQVDAKDAKIALKMFVHYMTQGGAVSHATFTAWLLYGLKQG